MNAAFYEALESLEKERNIPKDYMLEKIRAAIASTIKRDRLIPPENVDVEFNEAKQTMRAFIRVTVVETVENPGIEVTLDEARKTHKKAQIGDVLELDVDPAQVGRIAAKVGKNVIIQAINEAASGAVMQEFEQRKDAVVSGTVTNVDPRSGVVMVRIGRHELPLFPKEQIAGETFTDGQNIKVCITVPVPKEGHTVRGREVVLSRASTQYVRKLFELEVPEIAQGVVEIKAISREAGSRSKVAVASSDPNVEPVGSCIGARQSRLSSILENMAGERIDLIRYSEDPGQFVTASLSPANAKLMEIDRENKICRVMVPADSLSLAIGKGGQNVRLAARLTGYKIDIIAE